MTKAIYKQWYIKLTIGFAAVLLIGFIATSFGNVDRWFSTVLGEWIKVEFIKFWVVFFNQMGLTCLFLLLIISLLIIVESWYVHYREINKAKLLLYLGYGITLSVFLGYNLIRFIELFHMEDDWGVGVNAQFITNNTYKTVSRIIILFIETGILSGAIYFLRFKLSKTNVLVQNRAWVVGISALIFIIGSYFMLTLILKQTFGRPFWINVEFERYVGKVQLDETGWAVDIILTPEAAKLEAQFPDIKERILRSYNNGDDWTQADRYYKWYEINGNWFQNLKFWYGGFIFEWLFNLDPNYTMPACWTDRNFPSGHTISGFSMIFYVLFASVVIEDEKKRNKITNYLFVLWFITEFLMINLLVVARTHYISDTWFSFAFCTGFLFVSLKAGNSWTTKIVLKRRQKLGLVNEIQIINDRIFIWFQEDNKIKLGKMLGKRNTKKISKYLNAEQINNISLTRVT